MSRKAVYLLGLFGIASMLIGCRYMKSTPPKLEILSDYNYRDSVNVGRSGLDFEESTSPKQYVVKQAVRVRNQGAQGKVRLMSKLFAPEGQFYREQVIELRANEDKEFEFVFDEVSISETLLKLLLDKKDPKIRTEFTWVSVPDNTPLTPTKQGVDFKL